MTWRSERKIVTLPTKESHTPEVILARTLEKARAGKIRDVVVAIVWKDGAVSSDWSNMKLSDVFYALHISQLEIDEQILDPCNQGDNEAAQD